VEEESRVQKEVDRGEEGGHRTQSLSVFCDVGSSHDFTTYMMVHTGRDAANSFTLGLTLRKDMRISLSSSSIVVIGIIRAGTAGLSKSNHMAGVEGGLKVASLTYYCNCNAIAIQASIL